MRLGDHLGLVATRVNPSLDKVCPLHPETAGSILHVPQETPAPPRRLVGSVYAIMGRKPTPAERRRLFDVREREKFNSSPLAPGKRLVPLVLNDLCGINEMGMAALRAIAKEGARSTGSRVADALDIVLGGILRGYHRHAVRVGREPIGPEVADG